jgi:hypothetical protein
MLHEGTHAFMHRFLGGAGPPWYCEGMAELLGQHQWKDGKLLLGYNPHDKTEVPFLGRVKLVKDAVKASRGLHLDDILKITSPSLQNEQYAWCLATCLFFDQHPLTHDAFRELKAAAADRSLDFSVRFYKKFADRWVDLNEDWQLFITQIDYGYDVARAAVIRKPAAPLPAAGAELKIAADRGWQATGIQLEKGKVYQLTASGQFRIGKSGAIPWPCEPGGITLHYHQGRPLGMLLAAVGDLSTGDKSNTSLTPLTRPQPIGLSAELHPDQDGPLYLRLNDNAADLADNQGELTVRVEEKK